MNSEVKSIKSESLIFKGKSRVKILIPLKMWFSLISSDKNLACDSSKFPVGEGRSDILQGNEWSQCNTS